MPNHWRREEDFGVPYPNPVSVCLHPACARTINELIIVKNIINTHPTLLYASDLKEICNPLTNLKISYFGHANIDDQQQWSGLCNHPVFHEHYLQNQYYNADIHMHHSATYGEHILWDACELDPASAKMDAESIEYGLRHTFTIVKRNLQSTDYFHFATHHNNKSINQFYLTHIDLLNAFINHFKHHVLQSAQLSAGYEIKFALEQCETAPFYPDGKHTESELRQAFLNSIAINKRNKRNIAVVINKNTKKAIKLSQQQLLCLKYLSEGYSIKKIASSMQLSPRTVEFYLLRLRKLLACQNSKELVANYAHQL